ncbi:DUF1801 domain-containing protein [Runella sp. MFBS21]|uniref:iron chaperone n=1 Tax=Runella sp. MFBS21 TaxID=3034018 RepID=UPI0023F9C540|nr:DUF1801 domain-containing protein [Runella sp. MFBS21]MDF7819391.1 DUF1801 domain-containing protein [Runella sp. MFBS21]
MEKKVAKNIDEYIAWQPLEVQVILQQIRATVRAAAPTAQEAIKYAMPTFVLNGNLVYFAAFKKHIGFYPIPMNDKRFESDFKDFKTGKGSIQFPLDKPMPLDLITKIVKYRLEEKIKKSL